MEILYFLAAVGFISLTGVLMPGPVFTAAVVKGSESRWAGLWVALGHLLVEVPLIIMLALGFEFILNATWVKMVIGIGGGIVLLYMGISMFLGRKEKEVASRAIPRNPIWAGIVTTVTNPYFILWWATVGALFVNLAVGYGVLGLFLFIIVHESCDFAWDIIVSYTVNRSKKLWNDDVHAWVFGICGLFLAGFGVYFLFAPVMG